MRIRARRASRSNIRSASAPRSAAGYQYLKGSQLLMSVNQNVPTCVAAGTNNGCRPNSTYANNSQYSSVGDSNYHGLHVSLAQRTQAWGHYRVSYTLSKSMNNVGEFFFSSPIDPTDLSKDWGRSDNDQRHRLVCQRRRCRSRRLPVRRHGAGLFGAAVQHHLRRDHHPGHGGPADRRRRIHPAQRRRGHGVLLAQRARQPLVPAHGRAAARSAGGGIQPDRPRQRRHAQYQLRPGRVSDESARRPSNRSPPSASRARSSSAPG